MPPLDSDIDIATRIVRLETKLDILITSMDKLPPSPTCLHKHIEFESRFNSLDAWRNRIMGGILLFNVIVIFFLDKLKAVFFHTP